MSEPGQTHPATARFVAALAAAGVNVEVNEWPRGTRTAADAARAVGTTVDRIVKTLVFASGSDFVLALVPGDRKADPDKIAAAIGAPVRMASPADVKTRTGSSIGGVAPLGHRPPIRALVDARIALTPEVWVAAGTPTSVCRLRSADLIDATSERPQDICDDVAHPPR